MATATKTRPKTKAKVKARVREQIQEQELQQVSETPAITRTATTVVLYLLTGQGLEELIGTEGDWVRDKIKDDDTYSHLAYKHYDDDKRVWATWAVLQPDGQTIKPMIFPDPSEYGMTPPELYTKAVTFKSILGHAVGILRAQKETIWDKMMKPTTVIIAIVAILLVLGVIVIGAQG